MNSLVILIAGGKAKASHDSSWTQTNQARTAATSPVSDAAVFTQ